MTTIIQKDGVILTYNIKGTIFSLANNKGETAYYLNNARWYYSTYTKPFKIVKNGVSGVIEYEPDGDRCKVTKTHLDIFDKNRVSYVPYTDLKTYHTKDLEWF